jgi:glycosyltransferase involved in cell wall biosynthesis
MENKRIKSQLLSPGFLGLVSQGSKIYLCLKKRAEGKDIYAVYTNKNKKELISEISKLAKSEQVKIFAAGLSGFNDFEDLATDLWLKLDIVPSEKAGRLKGKMAALKASEAVNRLFDADLKPKVFFNSDSSVKEQFLTNLSAYRQGVDKETWKNLVAISEQVKEKKLKIAFINSTAFGGGVALMRHAIIRFYKLLGVDVKWLVLKGDKNIFTITKKKIHNVLHGIAAPEIYLSASDKRKYNAWIAKNYRNLKKTISKLDVLIVDDPQPSGLIPLVKKDFPEIKIMYRSHTQVYSKLIDKGVRQNKNSWDFVWSSVKLSDIFISHPIKRFVPRDVPKSKVLYLPATTDPIDGLNKKISKVNRKYYYHLFNSILEESGTKSLDLKRPYIIQVARFDPSKGIPDVLESYRKLRKKLFQAGVADNKMPQLVIVGNGANDDPESMPIYQALRQAIMIDTYRKFRDDIKIARLPHNDQLLNTLLSGALVSLQLSHREGFEVKVSEALMKGVPVVAYTTGGIPLQIEDGKSGYLIKRKRTKEVAQKIEALFKDKSLYKEMSKYAREHVSEDYLTVKSAYRWLFLSLALCQEGSISPNASEFKQVEDRYLDKLINA